MARVMYMKLVVRMLRLFLPSQGISDHLEREAGERLTMVDGWIYENENGLSSPWPSASRRGDVADAGTSQGISPSDHSNGMVDSVLKLVKRR